MTDYKKGIEVFCDKCGDSCMYEDVNYIGLSIDLSKLPKVLQDKLGTNEASICFPCFIDGYGITNKTSSTVKGEVMYGLFKNTYDYHEWHDFVCASNKESILAERVESDQYPLLSGEEQKEAEKTEQPHHVIEKIEVI